MLARWFIKRRGTAIGISMIGISAGGLIMSPLVGALNSAYDWRVAFIFLAVLVWVLGLQMTLLIIRGNPQEMSLLPDNDRPVESVEKGPEINEPVDLLGFCEFQEIIY